MESGLRNWKMKRNGVFLSKYHQGHMGAHQDPVPTCSTFGEENVNNGASVINFTAALPN